MANLLFSSFDLKKIVSGANNTVSFFNKAIPIYKQVTPTFKSIKNTISSFNSIKKSHNDQIIKEAKSFIRPINIYKKKSINDIRGKVDFNNLTFFADKKNQYLQSFNILTILSNSLLCLVKFLYLFIK